jgi:septal ring factor EnvC (AmiA/AmiB activator)
MYQQIIGLIFLVTMCACMQKTERHMGNMDKNTGRLADEVEKDQKYLETLSKDISSAAQSMKGVEERSAEISKRLENYEKYLSILAQEFSRLVASADRLEKNGSQMMEFVVKHFLAPKKEAAKTPDFDAEFENSIAK